MKLFDNLDFPKLIAGTLGSFTALYFFKNKAIAALVVMFIGGLALSYYATPSVVHLSGNVIDPGLAGYLLGLFGMTVAASVFSAWASLNFSVLANDWLRGFLHLPPTPPATPAQLTEAVKEAEK